MQGGLEEGDRLREVVLLKPASGNKSGASLKFLGMGLEKRKLLIMRNCRVDRSQVREVEGAEI